MTITKATITFGKQPTNNKLSSLMRFTIRAMRDLERDSYIPSDIGVATPTMQALKKRQMVRQINATHYALTQYGLDTINQIDERLNR